MNKYFILGAIALGVSLSVVSCSSRDEDSDNISSTQKSKVNPPSWIRGTWVVDKEFPSLGYTFTNNDIIQEIGNMRYSLVKELASYGAYSQTSSNKEFSFTIGNLNTYQVSTTLLFRKVDNNTIELVNGGHSTYFYKK